MNIQQTLNLRHISLPDAWDAQKLEEIRTQDGVSWREIIQDIDTALSMASAKLFTGYSGNLMSMTEEMTVEYPNGESRGFEEITERGRGEGRRVDTSGHMLPMKGWDYELNWTHLWMREAQRHKIDAQMDELVRVTIELAEQQIWTAFFRKEELTGKAWGLGANGLAAPFCAGADDTFAYIPPSNPERGGSFASTHDHYLRLDGITQANIDAAVKHLWEHGMNAPFDLICGQAAVSSFTNKTNVTGFYPRPDPLVAYGDNVSVGKAGEEYFGIVETPYGSVRLYANGRIPATHWGVTKVHGKNNPNNPLRVRKPAGRPFGPELISENLALYPLQAAVALFFFGVGVGPRRYSAVLVENDTSGDYATPTIS